MYNQNWQVVYGPTPTNADISPDTQVTEAVQVTFRMDGRAYSSPGPEITVSVYGEYADPNGQREDGSWPPVVVCSQIAYEIFEYDGNVNDADYEHEQGDREFERVYSPYPVPDYPGLTDAVMREAKRYAARGDDRWDWNGESAMHRTGGRAPGKAQ